MMFSSNQKLKVSGPTDIEYIKAALDFVMKYSGQIEHTTISEVDRGCLTVYQITETGSFCIGWGFKKVPDDWREFPFEFDSDIVARIIKQHLEKRISKRRFPYARHKRPQDHRETQNKECWLWHSRI